MKGDSLVQTLILFCVAMILFSTTSLAQTLDPIDMSTVNHVDLVDEALQLSLEEQALLESNHFVVSDEESWERFVNAYAWLYWKDLPVLITTDSMLHALHQSYADLLIDLEGGVMRPTLETFLTETLVELQNNPPTAADPAYLEAHHEVIVYLQVAGKLLNGYIPNGYEPVDSRVETLHNAAESANSRLEIGLFGDPSRDVDMTLFTPRGHYPSNGLSNYFRAMTWLGQIDFRLTTEEFNVATQQFDMTVYPNQIAAAMILRSAIDDAGQREEWSLLNDILNLLAGESDNTTLNDLDRFIADAGLSEPADVFTADIDMLTTLFQTNDYGKQRITGQIVGYDGGLNESENEETTALPTSFMVFGTRFAIDSWAMSQLVFDRVRDDNTGEAVIRAFPSTHDVAYILGNDHALTHLDEELSTYNYNNTLTTLRQSVDELPEAWWDQPVYNGWLNVIRSLNEPAADTRVPDVMKTAAWADKNLQTQLASWAQLRHDNILYIKQSFTVDYPVCEFPDWYIEPNVDFYEALIAYAQSGLQLTAQLEASGLSGNDAVKQADLYFASLEGVATILLDMVERQLNGEPATFEDNMFIQNIIVKHNYKGMIETSGGGPITFNNDRWDGWYTSLFYNDDDVTAVIADVHTNPTNDPASPLYPPRVLHAGTGDVSPIYMIADKGNGQTLYVGPAFSYYEVTTTGDDENPAERLTDELWQGTNPESNFGYTPRYPKPAAPEWTQSFRVSPDNWSERYDVSPSDMYVLRAKTANTLWDFVFGSLEIVPGTVLPPTEPSGVRVEAFVSSGTENTGGFSRYDVEFTNEGTIDRTQFSAQIFLNLSELYNNGYTAQDIFIEEYEYRETTCKAAYSGPHVWNESAHTYYLTIDLRRDSLNAGDRCYVAFDVRAVYPGDRPINHTFEDAYYYYGLIHTNPPAIDHTNDFSAQGLYMPENSWSTPRLRETTFIPIFDNNVMIGGSLPAEIPTFVDVTYALSLPAVQLRLLKLFGITLCTVTAIIIMRKRMKQHNIV